MGEDTGHITMGGGVEIWKKKANEQWGNNRMKNIVRVVQEKETQGITGRAVDFTKQKKIFIGGESNNCNRKKGGCTAKAKKPDRTQVAAVAGGSQARLRKREEIWYSAERVHTRQSDPPHQNKKRDGKR